jgi:hypothetical protein
MLSVYRRAAIALALVFPIGALADITGTVTLPPSFGLNLDNGASGGNPIDIQWQLTTASIRAIVTSGSAKIVNLGNMGAAGFAGLLSSTVVQLDYSSTSLDGNTDATSVLLQGDVFAVRTNGGNYAKVLVSGYSSDPGNPTLQDITLHWVTYSRVLPHLVMGPLGDDVWTTSILLTNATLSPTANVIATINFYQDNGQPLPLGIGIYDETHNGSLTQTANGQSLSALIAVRNSLTVVLSSPTFVEGWATINGPGITGQAVFHRHIVSTNQDFEAAVPVSTGGTEILVPFDGTSFVNGSTAVTTLPYITGMALANLDAVNPAAVNCTILNVDGSSAGAAAAIMLAPLGHTSLQLNAASGFAGVTQNIGALDCLTSSPSSANPPQVAVLGLRFLGVNGLTSFAPTIIQ